MRNLEYVASVVTCFGQFPSFKWNQDIRYKAYTKLYKQCPLSEVRKEFIFSLYLHNCFIFCCWASWQECQKKSFCKSWGGKAQYLEVHHSKIRTISSCDMSHTGFTVYVIYSMENVFVLDSLSIFLFHLIQYKVNTSKKWNFI